MSADMREDFARIIYEAMRYERRDTTPEWTLRGNSFAQDVARVAAIDIIRLIDVTNSDSKEEA